jgi:hypothetical protein
MRSVSDIIGAIVDYPVSHGQSPINSRTKQQKVLSLALSSLGLVDRNVGLMDKGRKGT